MYFDGKESADQWQTLLPSPGKIFLGRSTNKLDKLDYQ